MTVDKRHKPDPDLRDSFLACRTDSEAVDTKHDERANQKSVMLDSLASGRPVCMVTVRSRGAQKGWAPDNIRALRGRKQKFDLLSLKVLITDVLLFHCLNQRQRNRKVGT